MESEAPGIFWDEALCDIILGLRCTVAQGHGFTPFELIFKQQPSLVFTNQDYIVPPGISGLEVERYAEEFATIVLQ